MQTTLVLSDPHLLSQAEQKGFAAHREPILVGAGTAKRGANARHGWGPRATSTGTPWRA